MGWPDNDEQSAASDLENAQLRQNQAELEQKKQSLFQTRLDIIKGEGGQAWTPSRPIANTKSVADTQRDAVNAVAGGGLIGKATRGLAKNI